MPRKPSSFDGRNYVGYEIRLRIERNGKRYEPYHVRTSIDIYNFMRPLGDESAEHMYELLMDGGNRLSGVYLVGKGSCTMSSCDPKEIFKAALKSNAPSFALVHNHPSGKLDPSPEDLALAQRISEGAKLMNLKFLDAIIIGDGRYLSFADKGLL